MLKKLIEQILGRTLYDTPDDPGPGGSDKDDMDIMDDDKNDKDDDKNDDDKEPADEDKDDEDGDKDDDKTDEDDDKDDKEDEDENDDDDDKDDKDEDDDEELPENQIASVKDIKKDYPDFFKKHPEVKAAIFRDQQFSEILGSPKDAEDVVKRANTLATIEDDLFVKGDATKLLTVMKKNSPEAYNTVVSSLLPFIQESDKDTYLKIAALPIKQLLRNAWATGKGEKTNLGKAAFHLHEFFFGEGSKFEDKVEVESKKTNEKSQAQKDYEEKLSKINEREYTSFKGAIEESYGRKMSDFLLEDLNKDDRLSNFTRNAIVEKTLSEVLEQLKNDSRYQTGLKSLWSQAQAAEFNKDFKSRILNTALARAKSLAPGIRARLVKEALGKSDGKKKSDDKDEKKDKKQIHSRSGDRRDKPQRNDSKPKTDIDILRS